MAAVIGNETVPVSSFEVSLELKLARFKSKLKVQEINFGRARVKGKCNFTISSIQKGKKFPQRLG